LLKHIKSDLYLFFMTMNCPLCGTMMVWLNGSISHDPPVKYYLCRICNVNVTKQLDGSYEVTKVKAEQKK
jgi:transposase-like protein